MSKNSLAEGVIAVGFKKSAVLFATLRPLGFARSGRAPTSRGDLFSPPSFSVSARRRALSFDTGSMSPSSSSAENSTTSKGVPPNFVRLFLSAASSKGAVFASSGISPSTVMPDGSAVRETGSPRLNLTDSEIGIFLFMPVNAGSSREIRLSSSERTPSIEESIFFS